MKVKFLRDESLDEDEIQVEIKAASENKNVEKLLKYINNFSTKNMRNIITIRTSERIIAIKYENLIKVEVQGTSLTYYTKDEVYQTTGRLHQVLDNINDDFIQVSRHAIINLNYLESIEGGFAGNMIAILANNLKADISRRYLGNLKKELGL